MNLKIECDGKQYCLSDVSTFDELKIKLNETEPSLNIESFTYQDEEDDTITLANDEDFHCFLSNSTFVLQVQGKTDIEWMNKQYQKNHWIIKRISAKVKQLKERQRLNLLKRKELCQNGLNKLQYVKKEIILLEKSQKEMQTQIDELKIKLRRLGKVKITQDIKQDLLKTNICSQIQQTEKELNYNHDSKNKFRIMLEQVETQLCENFLQAYMVRAERFINHHNKLRETILKIQQLKDEMKENNLKIKKVKWNYSLKSTYLNMKMRAIDGLLKKN